MDKYPNLYADESDGLKSSRSSEEKLRWLRSQIVGHSAEFRSPYGRRRVVYADTTASGRSLLYIENYVLRHVLPFYGNTHTSDSYVGYRTTKMVKEATAYIKRCLGGSAEDAILFCGSGSTAAIKRLQEVTGIAGPAETLRERVVERVLRDEERWLVFVGPYEHHSNLLSWRRSLAEVVEIGLTVDGGHINLDDLRDQLERYKDDNRPMLGSFSACSNVTGIYSDTRAIATLLHQYGAFACFDFAASAPHAEVKMRSGEIDGYDAIFLSPHKFLGGPGSPGILLMNKALYLIGSASPSTCGGGTVTFVNGFTEEDTLYYDDIEERENAGTPPITQILRSSLAFWVKEYIGQKTIEEIERNYIQTSLKRLCENGNIEILGNTMAPRQAILSFLVYPDKSYWMDNTKRKALHGPFVAKLLNDLFGIQARGGCSCAAPYGHSLLKLDKTCSLAIKSSIQKGYHGVKPGWTRISFPYYLSNEEFEFILEGVEFVAKHGQRFLPLYHFDWKTGSWTFKSNRNRWVKHSHDFNSSEKDKIVNGEVSDEIDRSFQKDKDIAMYLATLLPNFPEHRKVPQDLDIDLSFMQHC